MYRSAVSYICESEHPRLYPDVGADAPIMTTKVNTVLIEEQAEEFIKCRKCHKSDELVRQSSASVNVYETYEDGWFTDDAASPDIDPRYMKNRVI